MGEFSDILRRARAARRRGRADQTVPTDGEHEPDVDWLEHDLHEPSEAADPWLFRNPAGLEPGETGVAPAARRIVLPQGNQGRWRPRAIVADQKGPIAESFRQLAVRVRAELERRAAKSVALVSPLRNDGKSTLACNLAVALASLSRGRDVAIVELDLRAPSLARALGIDGHAGVETYLEGKQGLAEICVSVEKPALDLYLASATHRAAHEYLVRPQMARLVRELERRHEFVVIDTPPVLLVPDAALILRHVATFAAVARMGATRVRAFRSMLDQLPAEKLIGGILNECPHPSHAGQYRFYQAGAGSPDER